MDMFGCKKNFFNVLMVCIYLTEKQQDRIGKISVTHIANTELKLSLNQKLQQTDIGKGVGGRNKIVKKK